MHFSDLEIIKQVNNGDTNRFSILVERYQQPAYKLALSILRRPADAEDAVSEAFIKAYTALRNCRAETNFKSWFLKITYNCCFDILRKQKKLQSHVPLEGSHDTPALESNPLQILEKQEALNRIWQAFACLTTEERAAIILKYYHDISYQDISDTLQWPLGSVASRLSRAREKLKHHLKGEII